MFHPGHPSSALAVVLVALLAPLAHAQLSVDFSALPQCAAACTPIYAARDSCLSAPATSISCFCASAIIPSFKSGSASECAAFCPSAADQQKISQWYVDYCSKNSDGQSGTTATTSTSSSTSTANGPTSSAPKSTATSNPVINDFDGDGDPDNNYTGSWISSHWQWVLMLAVIFLAMILFSVLGVWLKRRHRAKRDALRANLGAAPEDGYSNSGAGRFIPPPPPMAHLNKAPNNNNNNNNIADSASTINDAGSTTPPARANTMTRFPNSSMSNVPSAAAAAAAPQSVVWGPHQHQAATRGYEYHNNHPGSSSSNSGSPGPSLSSTPVNVPTPSLSPVSGFYNNNNNNNNNGNKRFSGGSSTKVDAKSRSRGVVIDEMADEDRIEAQPSAGKPNAAKERLRRKLSKR